VRGETEERRKKKWQNGGRKQMGRGGEGYERRELKLTPSHKFEKLKMMSE
jgi:hypothetical protein